MSLFDESEPAMRQLTRSELTRAYAEVLKAHPPVQSCAGDGPEADKRRMTIAVKDITRAFVAASRLGCTLQLVPLPSTAVTQTPPNRDPQQQP